MAPVLNYLDMVQRFLARTRVEASAERLYELNIADIQDFSKDAYMKQFMDTEPTVPQVSRAYTVAYMSAPTDEMREVLNEIFTFAVSEGAEQALEPMGRAERAMEDFLAEP